LNINQWKKKGNIAIWRYAPLRKNFPGWHITCDKLGYVSLIGFLELLRSSPVGAKRTISLDEPNINSSSTSLKKTAESKVVISLSSEPDFWNLKNEDGKLYLSLGMNSLKGLIDAVSEAEAGSYDFSFGSLKGQNLWFW